jgi:hypothetical protein
VGFLEVLTLIFVVLKIMGIISWSWWLVVLPEIISIVIYILWLVFAVFIFGSTSKKIKRKW